MRNSLILLALAGALVAATALSPVYAAGRTDINLATQLEPPSLDPTTGGAAAAIRTVTYDNIFEGLTKIDKDGAVQPLLAKSWDISPDGLTYTFHLQSGVKFHDGSAFSAADVKYSLDAARGEKSVNAQKQLFAKIASVDVVDPDTVKITLSGPQGDFLYNLGWGDAVIVSEKTAATNGTNPVGTGPYKFGEWVKGDHVTLEAFPDYWGAKPSIQKATIKIISDPTAAVAAILAGDVDAFGGFPAPEALEQIKADSRFQVIVGSSQGETVLAFNNGKAPLDNIKVREAVAHALDRKAIIDGAQFGYGTPIGSFYPPGDPAYVDVPVERLISKEHAAEQADSIRHGERADVKRLDTVAVCADQVAADAFGATLFGLKPNDLGCVRLGQQAGLGRMNLEKLNIRTIEL